jgi:hypothetical protein
MRWSKELNYLPPFPKLRCELLAYIFSVSKVHEWLGVRFCIAWHLSIRLAFIDSNNGGISREEGTHLNIIEQ